MANDATTQIPQGSHEADMGASAHDGDYAAVQVAEATAATTPADAPSPNTPADGKVVHVQIPQGGTVVRVPVQAGETVILPPPFDSHHDLAAKEGNGNLAIKVGDVTVILQGYIEAANDPQHPVTIDGSDGQPVDIAVVLASTDPNLDIQTAAGPAAGAQGADNTGAILAALAGGPGLGGLNAVGVLDATELQYKLIDNSIRQELGLTPNTPAGPLSLSVLPPNSPLHQSFLHDPVVTKGQLDNGHLDFNSFINGFTGFPGFNNSQADFDGTEAKPGAENEHAVGTIVVDPSNATTVEITLTTAGLEAQHLTSDGIALTYEVSADGKTIFGFRGDGTGGSDGALILVVHVGDPKEAGGTAQEFPVDYYLVNRIDDTSGNGTQTNLDVSFDVQTGDDRSTSGTITETVLDDNPIAASDSYDVKNHDGITVNATGGVESNDKFGADGKIGSVLSTPGTGGVVGVEAGDTKATHLGGQGTDVHGQFGTLHLNADGSFTYTRDDTGPTKGDQNDVFTYTIEDDDGDLVSTTLNVHINDHGVIIVPPPPPGGGDDPIKLNADGTLVYESALATGSDPAATTETTSGKVTITAPDGIATAKITDANGVAHDIQLNEVITGKHGDLTITGWNPATGDMTYSYTLKDAESVSGPGNNIDLKGEDFKITATDTDGDPSSGDIVIAIVDDVPTAHADADIVNQAAGSTTSGNVVSGAGDKDSSLVADVKGADQPVAVVGIENAAKDDGKSDGKGGFDVTGTYGTLHMNADGTYTYTVGAGGMVQGKDDVFTYTIQDKDGDVSTTTLTIDSSKTPDITQETPGSHPGEVDVYEAGLPTGSKDGPTDTTASGTFLIDSHGEGFQSLTVGGVGIPLNGAGLPIIVKSDATGTFEITGVTDKGNGAFEITYEYDLKSPVTDTTPGSDGHNAVTLPTFDVTAIDTSGDPAHSTITVKIVDDVPFAHADADHVTYSAGSTTAGNVITGAGDATSALVADTKGADQPATITSIENAHNAAGTSDGKGGFNVTGDYGTLHINADGSYLYTVGANGIAQGKNDVFTYTLTDADGDKSTTTLTIDTVTKPDITQETPNGHPGEVDVYEAGLSNGSKDGPTAITATGTFLIDSHGEGFQSLTVGGKDVPLSGGGFPVIITSDATGTLEVTGVADKGNGKFEITYEYDLKDNILDTTVGQDGHNAVVLPDLPIVVTDKSGDVANSTISVHVVDDIPFAKIDTDTVNVAATSKTTGNVITGVGDSDSHLQADISGADGPAHISAISNTKSGSVAEVAGKFTIVGDHGTLVIAEDGTYTYTVGSTPMKQGDTDKFTYTIVDADGDTSTTTLTIDVNCPTITQHTPDTPGSTPGLAEVYEAGLPAGSHDGPTNTVSTGTFTIDSHNEGFSSLVVGGKAIDLTGNGGPVTLSSDATGTMQVTGVHNDGNGAYTLTYQYTLNHNILDSTPGSDGHNAVTLPTYSVVATDKSGDVATSSLTVNVVDDIPVAHDSTKSMTTLGGNYNILLTIDLSNSMNDSSHVSNGQGGTFTKLELEKAAIAELLNTYKTQGDVAVHVVWFNDPGSGAAGNANPGYGANDGGWMNVTQAIAYVNGLVAQGNTNYDVAVNEAEKSFDNLNGYIANGTNISYFFSDGMPNENSGPGSDGQDGVAGKQQADWEGFLDTHNINSYAIGVGTQAVASALTPLAYDGATNPATDPAGNTIVVTNLNQLSSVINATVPQGASGNLVGDVGGTYGADGAGHINSFSVDGGAAHNFDAGNPTVTVATSEGTFVLNMITGEYTYTPKAGVAQDGVNVTFNMIDGDGDVSGNATLHLVPTNHAPVIDSNGGGDTAAVSVVENTTVVTQVHATDADIGATLAFSITGGADKSLFTIDSNTGALSFVNAPDFENPLDAGKNNVYDVVVTATDNKGATDAQDISVTVTNSPELQATADTVYTTSGSTIVLQDSWLTANDKAGDAGGPLKITAENQAQQTNLSVSHDGTAATTTLSNLFGNVDNQGEQASFHYKVANAGNVIADGTVTVIHESTSTIDHHTATGDLVMVGTSASGETFLSGSGDDVIATGGGSDKVDGGSGFDQVALSGNQTWSANYTHVEMANLHDGASNKLTINAADVFQQTAATVGGKDVDLFVTGDHAGAVKDSVALNGFSGAAVATNVTFTDAGTNTAHTYDLYQGTGTHTGVVVAVEHDLNITVTP